MGGIAGVIYPDVFQVGHLIQPMLRSMPHRGQRRTYHAYKNCELGSCSGQLTTNAHRTVWTAYDGSIFNRSSLIKDLKQLGYEFPLGSTGEVIVHAYDAWGKRFIQKLNGDFAIVILDERKQRLYLFRDRIGKKPLYWYRDHHHFFFASELKALLATGAIPQTMAEDAIAAYLHFGYIPQDMSPIKNVNKLLPAHYLQLTLDHTSSTHSYWSLSELITHKGSSPSDDIPERLDSLLSDAVRRRIPFGKPASCLLSGGLGSASIAYYLSKLMQDQGLCAFTAGFEGEHQEDLKAATTVTEHLNIKHFKETIPPAQLLDSLAPIIWHLDEPIADPHIVTAWHLTKEASKHTRTVFTGMGADELLAGHVRYLPKTHPIGLFKKLNQLSKPLLRKLFLPILSVLFKDVALRFLKHYPTNPWHTAYLEKNAIFQYKDLKQASPKLCHSFDPEVFLHRFQYLPYIKSKISSIQYFEIKTRLPDCFMLQYDRLTAAHGLTWQTPFLDENVIKYLVQLPEPKVFEEEDIAAFLRQLFHDRLPSKIVNRRKIIRPQFLGTWVSNEEFQQTFRMIEKGTLVDAGLIHPGWLKAQLDRSLYDPTLFRRLWSILCLETWFRLFINRPVSSKPPDEPITELLSVN